MKILVVDDDTDLGALVGFALRQAGYLVVEAVDGEQALARFEAESPSLVILDLNLPKLDGFEVCRRLRQSSAVPILFLTVRSQEEDLVRALDLGADDFLAKPFSPRTLLARVRALLRRAGMETASVLVQGGVALDPDEQAVRLDGESRRLTRLEFRLLQLLFAQAGKPVPAERLIAHVWGGRGGGDRQLLKQLIHRLRQKVETDPARPTRIVSMPGGGYRLEVGGVANAAE